MPGISGLAALIMIVTVTIKLWRRRRHGGPSTVGPGAAGATYDFLNQDKRAALEIVIEERASYRDPEDKDGNLPDLAGKKDRNSS